MNGGLKARYHGIGVAGVMGRAYSPRIYHLWSKILWLRHRLGASGSALEQEGGSPSLAVLPANN
jgi:hypothetical protein